MADLADQIGKTFFMPAPPRRIISLVPSQTELLADLGLEREVIGITKFCIHPDEWFRSKERVGGTKQLNLGKIRDLQPDLIIANKEENTKEQIETLRTEFPVWITDIETLEDALEMILQAGSLTGRSAEASVLAGNIVAGFLELGRTGAAVAPDVAYLIWKEPYMTVGRDTFIHSMLETAGYRNVFGERSRYPEITLADLKKAAPAYIFLSSEPYPFRIQHQQELQAYLPHSRVILVDGEMFSWYGSRLQYTPAYFRELWQRAPVISS